MKNHKETSALGLMKRIYNKYDGCKKKGIGSLVKTEKFRLHFQKFSNYLFVNPNEEQAREWLKTNYETMNFLIRQRDKSWQTELTQLTQENA